MTPRAVNSRHALESCTLQLQALRPFQIHTLAVEPSKPYTLHAKQPCRSDRSTAPGPTSDALDLSRLTLVDDPTPLHEGFLWIARKRQRRGSCSVSGRSSDRSGTRRRGGGGASSVVYATCSDFPMAAGGTDSSGELFANGEGSWGSDASEARASGREARDVVGGGGGGLERESSGSVLYQAGGGATVLDLQGNESGYGSEPGYRGDVEFGYDDEFDDEEDEGRPLFWGDRCGGMILGGADGDRMEIVGGGENKFSQQLQQQQQQQKAHHHRCSRRSKKHYGSDWRMIAPLR